MNSCQSQLELTKEFDENEYICSYHHFDGVDLYATFDKDNNEIKIYNSNHILQRSLIYDPGRNHHMLHIYGLSKDVFNSDSNIEFLIYKLDLNDNLPKMFLINDQNTVLQEFNGSAQIRTIGNKNYIVESISETNYDQTLKQAINKQTDKLYAIKGKFRKLVY